MTSEARIAVAKAAWAMGLSERAAEGFENVLRTEKLTSATRARLLLSRGIIEFQEERHEVSMLFAEKAVSSLPEASPLRSKAWLLWGENLYANGSYGAAEQKYLQALDEALNDESADIHYRLGLCQMRLAKHIDAKKHLESIPFGHPKTADAIRYLAQIALEADKFSEAEFWLKKGRNEYPDAYLDSWIDYAFVHIAISEKNEKEVSRIQQDADAKYPPSDHWLTLLKAAAESWLWRRAENRRSSHATS